MLIIYLMNLLMQQNLNFQLTPHISILIPISSTSLFFQLTHQFSWISIPIPSTNLLFYLTYQFNLISISIPSTKVLPMCLLTIPLALHLTICFYANQLIYKVRRKKVQGRKTKSQKRMPKNILFFHLVKNHAAEGELPTFPLVIER